MRNYMKVAITTVSTLTLAGVLGLTANIASAEEKKEMTLAEKGQALAFDRKKGNCLACHMIPGGDMAGTIAPPLIAMKARFKKEALRAQIAEPRTKNPNSMMPPFEAHGVLSGEEIDAVVEYVHGL
ncbi:MAG: Sulfur oxidation protein SoxX [uncultured Thiotrichaceae bacterium]|uniref:Sulfur oxidation protein SoxX n=1 Tax=uncultured Thiotrichaceae bacterium TaxID=298394 RepID=A0A6S6U9X8_9GAMM|nr:MAG: Sulfur oxidation protein SoxX [uncultured Thiotrichaceae bacterium]